MFKRPVYRFEKPIAANYETPSGVSCVEVHLPDALDHLAILQGLMAVLAKEDFWDGTEAERAQLSYLWEVAWAANDWSNCMTPKEAGEQDNITLWHIFSTKDAGNNFISNKAVNNGGVTFQNTSADGDQWHTDRFNLRAGTWRVRMLCVKLSSGGKLYVNLVAAGVGGVIPVFAPADLYSAATVENFIFSADVTVVYPGYYIIESGINGHTSPSSAYLAQITCINLHRVGD